MTNTTEITSRQADTCLCGCGAFVTRRFRPGHDAKLKGQLLRQSRSLCGLMREPAVRRMVELGWGHMLPVQQVAALPVRSRGANGRFVRSAHIEQVRQDGAVIDAQGTTHAHTGCADVVGDTSAATVSDGWACGTCIHTADATEIVGSMLAAAR